MEILYSTSPDAVKRMTTEELRKSFFVDRLFIPDTIQMFYSDTDRAIIGSAVPIKSILKLLGSKKEMSCDNFCERREIGIINIGGEGAIVVDEKKYLLDKNDMLYAGRGTKDIEFHSININNPAGFYFVSYAAHREYPTKLIRKSDSEHNNLGNIKDANKRTINKYIHPNGVQSCQLVMGMTELEEGSVWNTMPVHTHQRQSEVYMYFNLNDDAVLMHFFGEPNETRHLIIRNRQAVISPIWSIHSGCGTQNYSFVWAMGGESQEFSDMDAVLMKDLL